MCVDTEYMNERKWHQPQFQLHLITESRGRRELGLPTLSAVVHLWKMMLGTMFQSIQTLYEWQIYWAFPLFRAQRLSFSYFRLRTLWIDHELHVLALCTNFRLCCTHFFCITVAKYITFCCLNHVRQTLSWIKKHYSLLNRPKYVHCWQENLKLNKLVINKN